MHAARVARGMLERGVRRGDRVVLHMPNRPELAVAIYACFHLGAIAVPLNNQLKTAELKPLLQRLQPALYIGATDLYGEVRAIDASILPPDRRCIAGAARGDAHVQAWATLSSNGPAKALEVGDTDSPALLLATSGTTGIPKFVIHTPAT